RGASVNVVSTVGAGLIRASVMGYDDRPPTDEEMERMRALVAEAMEEGAIGLSSGMVYPPNSYFTTEEMIALAEPAAEAGGIYLTHIRNEGDGLVESVEEAITIGREAGLPVEILHFKRYAVRPEGPRVEPTIRDAVALIDSVRAAGREVAADLYPYAAAQTGLDTRIPEWAHDGGRERMVERLRDPGTRARIVGEIRESFAGGRAAYTPETIMLGGTPHEPHRQFLGMRISEISEEMGMGPAETLVELVEKGEGRVRAIYFGMREEDVRYLLRVPWTTIGSDGTAVAPEGVFLESHPHPRWYGSFPRVLGRYVREEGVLELPEAIRKMTSLAASRVDLEDRGTVAPGMKADLVAFDPATIIDRATFTDPHRLSGGVMWLVVNGEVVIAEGEHTGATPGRAL
ncbi:MAG: amidohydrolase family protein, partial [Gemmatimonadetes bacterium]|nr:amidohydrolase family protein [Gemmatimonadota bacterium]NIR77831.1 amidohydrolase family protein [Gemmatimonadota bacterium]NIT87712.1 amidohydrolase family protein [Gemmatimonadota bacterium]NIU30217.1 amidohydrolase family protein [Gemmatimonadota bacterium]NIU35125.1 amidohydrolase family protein [Gemmatimonadota bacterium]